MTKKVLFITTSADKIGEDWDTGIWLEELTAPYYILSDNNVNVDIASPKGSNVPFDKTALEDEHITESVTRFLSDDSAKSKLASSKRLDRVNFDEYDAIFFPGGHGAIVDLPHDQILAEKLGKYFDTGKHIASICHGPGGLVLAKRKDGKSIIDGKRFTCFSNEEEKEIGVEDKVPFLLQSKLEELGGKFEKGDNFAEHVVVDGNIITGQNPASSEKIGKILLDELTA